MVQLPNEIYRQILSPLDLDTLQACRLAGRSINQAATELAFRHVRLRVLEERSSSTFVQLASASHLRPLVREVTIDAATTTYPRFNDFRIYPSIIKPFLYALPFLRVFTGLKSLKLVFAETRGISVLGMQMGCLILDTSLRCLAGEWSCNRQARLENELLRVDKVTEWPPLVTTHMEPMEATIFTVSGLPVSPHALAIPDMVLSCKSLTNLELQLATSIYVSFRQPFRNFHRQLENCSDYFQNIPKVWLPPAIARNLRVLSLSFEDYWGWTPRMDLRTVNPGDGLPNLRVLWLGCYVFSHEWQVDWIASLGRQTRRGGLEELYLNDCPIMWEARVNSALDESTTTFQTANGDLVHISNAGYPTHESLKPPQNLSDLIAVHFPLRWNHVLDHWAKTMSSLEVFIMGAEPQKDLFLQTKGLREPREWLGLVKYVHFNIAHRNRTIVPEPWIEQDDRRRMIMEDDGLEMYNAARKADYDSYDNLMDTIEHRLK